MSEPVRPVAAVTGATGFIGRRVVDRLLADGWAVRALARRSPAGLPSPVQVVEGRLDDQAALRWLVAGARVVVHVAGIVAARRARDFHIVNVNGSACLGEAVRLQAPSARLVVVSSLAAREPAVSAYARSKAEGERAVLDAAEVASWAVLRPSAVYGPGDRATLAMFRAARMPVMPVPDRPKAALSLLHVDDCAAAVAAACRLGAGQVVWEVGEGRYGWTELARHLARAVGGDPRILPLGRTGYGVLARVAGLAGLLFGQAVPLSPGKVAEMFHADWICHPDRLPPSALWRPGVPLAEGLARTAGWYRAQGWL